MAKKQDAKTPVTKLTATERSLLLKLEETSNQLARLEHRQILTEEALQIVTNTVSFLLDIHAGKLPSPLPEKTVDPDSCRCHAEEPSCGSLNPYFVPEAS